MSAGTDTEMPMGIFYSENATMKALESGSISEDDITMSAVRVLTAMYSIGMFDENVRQVFYCAL